VDKDIGIPKEIIVTAWYTLQIPVSNGPREYLGLPGLILEINTDRTTILFTEVAINTSGKIDITIPTKGKKITRKKYNETLKLKTKEMREPYRGVKRRGIRGRTF
tara:strand:- start:3582 stop:3896 length:315 start_codon:yes stop_codon:yes gene_type:complete